VRLAGRRRCRQARTYAARNAGVFQRDVVDEGVVDIITLLELLPCRRPQLISPPLRVLRKIKDCRVYSSVTRRRRLMNPKLTEVFEGQCPGPGVLGRDRSRVRKAFERGASPDTLHDYRFRGDTMIGVGGAFRRTWAAS
jgi:hypothetical protein